MDITYGIPPNLPPANLNPQAYYRELEAASYALGMLQVAHGKISNSEHLIKPLLTREASVSSKIEGTITDSKDVFILDATGKAPKHDTIVVANYREAMRLAIAMSGQKISNHKIRQLHSVLLRNTPHKGTLGKFRTVDAWIGKQEDTPIEKAIYVASHHTQITHYMQNLVDYLNNYNESPLVKTAIFHYQFEAIHPFEDGNGRIGRMLVPALLYYQGKLSAPVLYTSQYFETKSDQYRAKLREVDTTGDLTPWIIFFLGAIKEQCAISIELVNQIIELSDRLNKMYETAQSPNIRRVLEFIFERPVFSIPDIVKKLHISRITATSIVRLLEQDRVIESLPDIKGHHGATVYYFPGLIRLIA